MACERAPPGVVLTRSPDDRRAALARGHAAEEHVERLLRDLGWTVLARNWRGGGGELDLVVERRGLLRFVEVKARDPGGLEPHAAVTGPKRRRLRAAARAWLAAYGPPDRECAFLVAFVTLDAGQWTVEWVDDAF